MYGDEKGTIYEKEIPKEFWHDQKRVDEWIEGRKKARNNADSVEDLRPKDGYTHYLDK